MNNENYSKIYNKISHIYFEFTVYYQLQRPFEIPDWCFVGYKFYLVSKWIAFRDNVLIEILVLITILDWHQLRNLVMSFCHICIYEITEIIDIPNCINRIRIFLSENIVQGRTSLRYRLVKLSSSGYTI